MAAVSPAQNFKMTNWTHVKDFMPERDGWYLVVGLDGIQIAQLTTLPDGRKWESDCDYCSGGIITNVTHWAPVPNHPAEAA